MTETVAAHRHHVEDGHHFTIHVEQHLARSHRILVDTHPDPPLAEAALAVVHDLIHTLGITLPVGGSDG